jgi:hypothetical protein
VLRPKRRSSASEVSSAEATYVLERLIAEGRISAEDVHRYVSEMFDEISHLEARLQQLRIAADDPSEPLIPPAPTPPPPRPGGKNQGGVKRRVMITRETLVSRQLQGRYLALIRQIPAIKRAQYAKTAKEKGRQAAIDQMKRALEK